MIKGDPAEEVDLHRRGGVFGGVRHTIVGMPTFEPGERVVLFLTANDGRGHAWPVGLGQGKFRVLADTAIGNEEPRVFQSLSSGATYLSIADNSAAKPAAGAPRDGLYLSEFVSLVQGLEDSGAAGDGPDAR